MHKVVYKHWKTDAVLEVTGIILHDHPASDRIVIEKADGSFEDVIKNTIVTIEEVE